MSCVRIIYLQTFHEKAFRVRWGYVHGSIYISAKTGIDDHLMLFQIVRAKGKISTFKSNLSGERSDFSL